MADKRISQLVERTDIANNDVVPIVASGATTTNKATISSIQEFMQENLDLGVTSVGITLGSSGTDVSVTGSPITTSGNITINFPTASATNRGLLSPADWTTFNDKQPAGNYVTLDTTQSITATKSFITGGGGNTLTVSQTSGSGIALNITKFSNGEGLKVEKFSGTGNAATIIGGLLSTEGITSTAPSTAIGLLLNGRSADNVSIIRFGANTGGGQYNTIQSTPNSLDIGSFGNTPITFGTNLSGGGGTRMTILGSGAVTFTSSITASSIIRTGGTSSQFLKADGSVDSSTYLTTGTAASTYVPYTGATGAVDLGTHTLSSNNLIANGGLNAGALLLKNANAASTINTGYFTLSPSSTTTQISFGFSTGASTWKKLVFSSHLLTDNTPTLFSLPNGGGTLAVTTDLGAYLPLTGGTLTGALNGTSASFSSTTEASNASTASVVLAGGLGVAKNIRSAQNIIAEGAGGTIATLNGGDIQVYTSGNANFSSISSPSNGNMVLKVNIGATPINALTLASTGAATFSSSVTAGGNISNSQVTLSNAFPNITFASNGNIVTTGANPIDFRPNDVIAMRITSGGNVGIGTASPINQLDINNISTTFWDVGFNAVLNGGDSELRYISAGQSGGRTGSHVFYTGTTLSGTERMRITSDGFARLSASSGGIQFNGDTAAANALDDYEEGTWDMGVSFGGASVGVTYTIRTGQYTKIGRQVTVTGYCVVSDKGSSTGVFRITGLPVGIASGDSNYAACTLYFEDVSYDGTPMAYGNRGNTTINVFNLTEAGANAALTDADCAASFGFIVNMTYFT